MNNNGIKQGFRKSIPDGAISFEFNGHLVFNGAINDSIKARWVYDTGSPLTVVDSTFYVENGNDISDFVLSSLAGGGNNRADAYIVKGDFDISVKDISRNLQNAFVIDLRKAVGDKTADGILDICFFGKYKYEINYVDEYLIVHQDNYSPDSSWFAIPFEFRNRDRIIIDAWVEIEPGKRISGPFILDLGATGSYGISTHSAEAAKLSKIGKKVRIMDLKDAGIGGSSTIVLLEADKCGFGPYVFSNVPGFYSTNTAGAFGNENSNGIIGNRILSRFDLIIDFENHKLYFRPNKFFENEFLNNEGIGCTFIDRTISRGGFEINGIVRNSFSDSAGLMLSDLILSCNGHKFEITDQVQDIARMLDSIFDQGELILNIKRGEVFKEFKLQK